MACTVVTAYYEIKSKFNKQQYMEWTTTFFKIKSPIVLFTTAEHVEIMMQLRGTRPLHIIVTPFEELDAWKLYKDKWMAQHAMDPERKIHSPELYAVWAQKAFFVESAVHQNPFQTEYFFWCDIGAFRDPHLSPLILETFPHTRYLEPHRLLFQSVGSTSFEDRFPKPDGIYGEVISEKWNERRMVGGLWGGGKQACLIWKVRYQAMLERYFDANRFAGKDQQVMFSAYQMDPSIARVVQCTKQGIDIWFFLQHLLSKVCTRFSLSPTYSAKP